MALTANQQFEDALLRHQTYLLRYAGSVRNRIWTILGRTEEDISDKIRSRLANNAGLTTAVELRRLQSLVDQIKAIRAPAWAEANELLKEEMVSLSLAESAALDEMVKVVLPVMIETALPSARSLRSIALARPFQGAILGEWAASMEADDIRRIHNAIQLGMTAGEPMDVIARRVVGTGTLMNADGQTEMTRRQVQAVVRTAVQHVANHARTAWFLENSDIVTTERFVATLDSRTTPICRANDGKQYPMGKGPIPPLHWQCRSLRVAVFDGILLGERPAKPYVERELVEEYSAANGLGNIRTRADLPYGTKGAYDKWARGEIRNRIGPVPADTTYNEWLKRQSRTFQEDTLGVTKAKLFRDGGLHLDRFVNRNGDELTLAQMAQRERGAFIAAGLDPDKY